MTGYCNCFRIETIFREIVFSISYMVKITMSYNNQFQDFETAARRVPDTFIRDLREEV